MNKELRKDAEVIAFRAIEAVKPDAAVARALHNVQLTGNIYLVSVGKAAWQMAAAAVKNLKVPICGGIVVTKYDHVMADIPGVVCYEAGHPVPDENSFRGAQAVVHLKGNGLGGRNQELALAAAEILDGIANAAFISVGSDGTDGPTDAAGGYADSDTVRELNAKGMDIRAYLDNNDAYHALQAVENLIITGPTGTNVNDVTVGLIWG